MLDRGLQRRLQVGKALIRRCKLATPRRESGTRKAIYSQQRQHRPSCGLAVFDSTRMELYQPEERNSGTLPLRLGETKNTAKVYLSHAGR